MADRIAELKGAILAGGPSLQEMHDFAMRDFAHEQVVRQMNTINAVHAKGEYPVRVGNFIVVDKSTLRISRPLPPYAKTT